MKIRMELAAGLMIVGLAIGVAHCNNSSNNTGGQGSSGNEQVTPVEDAAPAGEDDAQAASTEPVDSGVIVDTGVIEDTGVIVDTGVVVDSGVRRRRR